MSKLWKDIEEKGIEPKVAHSALVSFISTESEDCSGGVIQTSGAFTSVSVQI
jgi:hypothetical protein